MLDHGTQAIISQLQRHGTLLQTSPYMHRYPYDWRTKKPIIMRATKQWFADLTPIRTKALAALDHVQVQCVLGWVACACNYMYINVRAIISDMYGICRLSVRVLTICSAMLY